MTRGAGRIPSPNHPPPPPVDYILGEWFFALPRSPGNLRRAASIVPSIQSRVPPISSLLRVAVQGRGIRLSELLSSRGTGSRGEGAR